MLNTIVALFFVMVIMGSDYMVTGNFSLFSTLLFSIFTLFITLFLKFYRAIYLIILLLGTTHHLFFNYFHRTIKSTDISLFYLHIEETFESFFSLSSLFILSFILSVVGLFFIIISHKIKTKTYHLKGWIKYPLSLLLVICERGQHSLYRYFSGLTSPIPKENYKKSIYYSFELYAKIYQRLLATKEPSVFIYTSDHGEFTGEGGRYGHNIFKPNIYEVPLFIASNTSLPKGYKKIISHHHLAQYITYLLGYQQELNLSQKAPIINGTMLSREDGYITIKEQL